jgi:thioredoxin reductase (NADPH)
MAEMRAQAERFGADLVQSHVTSVDLQHRPFTVSFADGRPVTTHALIIATGASARWLEIGSDRKLSGRGVSTCATCDGFFFRNREVVVIGGGDSALEEALYLSKMTSKVTLIHRRDAFRASKIMQQRVFDNPKIDVVWDTVVDEVLGDETVSGVRLRNLKTGATTDFRIDGLFVAIGHDPNTGFLNGAVATDDKGYIVPVEHTMTNVPGVFAAGDVVDTRYRQAVTAAGDGCRAAMDAERWIEAHGHVEHVAAEATAD